MREALILWKMKRMTTEFWKNRTLDQLNAEEWELLCDGCGKCCLTKLEDEDSGEVYHTDVACKLLNIKSCRCSNYRNRKNLVPDCIKLDAKTVRSVNWLPDSCAYRRVDERRPLPEWHHLVCGNKREIHRARASVCGRVISEEFVHPSDLPERIIYWV